MKAKKLLKKALILSLVLTMIFSLNISSLEVNAATQKVEVFYSMFTDSNGNDIKDECTVIKITDGSNIYYGAIDLGGGEQCAKFIASIVGTKSKDLNFLIITHFHADHYNGLNYMTSNGYNFKFKHILANEVSNKVTSSGDYLNLSKNTYNKDLTNISTTTPDIQYVPVNKNSYITIGGIRITAHGSFLKRGETAKSDGTISGSANVNAHSMIVNVSDTFTQTQYIFGGDISEAIWNSWIIGKYTNINQVMETSINASKIIYKISHHGVRAYPTINQNDKDKLYNTEQAVYNFLSQNNKKVIKCVIHNVIYSEVQNEYFNVIKKAWKDNIFKLISTSTNSTSMFIINNGTYVQTNTNKANLSDHTVSKTGFTASNKKIGVYSVSGNFYTLKTKS